MSARRFFAPFAFPVFFFCFGLAGPFEAIPQVGDHVIALAQEADSVKDHRGGDDGEGDDRGSRQRCHEKKVEGFITDIDPASGTLVVGVVLIRTDEDTRIDLFREDEEEDGEEDLQKGDKSSLYEMGTLEDLEVGDFVRVDYCGAHYGTPLAIRIRQRPSEHRFARVEGKISEIDIDLLQLVVNSVLVRTTGATEFRSVHEGRIEFDDLGVGDYVRVFGRPMTDGSISAIKVHRKRSDRECRSMLRGLVNDVDIDSGTLVVGIVEVHTLAVTEILDASGEAIELGDIEIGDTVKVEYCTVLGVPVASRIRVQEPDDMDLDEDGEVSHGDILDVLRERSGEGLLDFDGDNRTTGRDLFKFSPRWKGRRH